MEELNAETPLEEFKVFHSDYIIELLGRLYIRMLQHKMKAISCPRKVLSIQSDNNLICICFFVFPLIIPIYGPKATQ